MSKNDAIAYYNRALDKWDLKDYAGAIKDYKKFYKLIKQTKY